MERYEGYKKLLLKTFGGKEENWLLNDEAIEKIEDQLRTLTNREAEVIRLRFGLKDSIRSTRKDISQHFNIPLSKVKRIEDLAMQKLRLPSRARTVRVCFQLTPEEKMEDLTEENTRLCARIAKYEKMIEEIRDIVKEKTLAEELEEAGLIEPEK